MKQIFRFSTCLVLALLFAGCDIRQRMYDQPKVEPLEASEFFADGSSARNLIEGTVARGKLKTDTKLHAGGAEVNGNYAFHTETPFEMTLDDLKRGQQRYDIYCSVCHGKTGVGDGMVVLRGYTQPPSYHTDTLREQPVGYFFHIATNGKGIMSGYADQVGTEDRWRIAAYVKTLQLAQTASEADFKVAHKLEEARVAAEAAAHAHGHDDHGDDSHGADSHSAEGEHAHDEDSPKDGDKHDADSKHDDKHDADDKQDDGKDAKKAE